MADTAASGVVMCKFHCEGGYHGHTQTRCRYAHRAVENGRVLKLTRSRKATCSVKMTPCLRCGRKPADAPGSEGANFRPK